MRLLLNEAPIIILRLSPLLFDNCLSRSASTILNLNKGDILYVQIPTVGLYYADTKMMQTFSGMRLF